MSDDMTTPRGGRDDADDAALLAELRELAAIVDPVPAEAVAAALSAFAWRTMDAELAELTGDTSIDPVGVRGGSAPVMLTFESPRLSIQIEISEAVGVPEDEVERQVRALHSDFRKRGMIQ